MVINGHGFFQTLTLWKAIPHVQPIIFTLSFAHQQRVVLQIEGLKGERDLCLRWGDDDVGTLQIVRILVRKTRRLNHPGRGAEISETVLGT